MSVTSPSIVVGVFRDRSMAEQALEALYSANFTPEQIRYSVPASGSFFDDLRRLFKSADGQSGNLASDLVAMGLSNEEARYYIGEYLNGRIILAVQTLDRRQDALSILHLYGASIPHAASSPEPSPPPADSKSSVICEISVLPIEEPQPIPLPAAQESLPPQSQPQPSIVKSHMQQLDQSQSAQVTSSAHSSDQPQPALVEPAVHQQSQPHPAFVEHNTHQQNPAPIMQASECYDTQPVAISPASTSYAQPLESMDLEHHDPSSQAQLVLHMPDYPYHITQLVEAQQSLESPTTYQSLDELHYLQEQLQAAQQQLQEAKAQLQTEKEREAQLKERHQQIQKTRQHLQATLSELEATLNELRETQERVKQYQ